MFLKKYRKFIPCARHNFILAQYYELPFFDGPFTFLLKFFQSNFCAHQHRLVRAISCVAHRPQLDRQSESSYNPVAESNEQQTIQ
jgi:hypothetical protein